METSEHPESLEQAKNVSLCRDQALGLQLKLSPTIQSPSVPHWSCFKKSLLMLAEVLSVLYIISSALVGALSF